MENVIQETTDYGQFKTLDANREINRGHVEAIKKAIETQGNLTRVRPVLVNNNFEIVDGQHGYTACKELGIPVFYTVIPGLGIGEARSMNAIQKNWSLDDYVKSYAQSGDTSYQRLLTLRTDNELSWTLILSSLSREKKGIYAELKRGEVSVSKAEYDKAQKKLDKVSELIELNPIFKLKPGGEAILRLMNSPLYRHARMKKKIQNYGDRKLRALSGHKESLAQLEEIYNFGNSEANRVRLY